MKVRQALQLAQGSLIKAGIEEAPREADLMIAYLAHCSPANLLLHLDKEIDSYAQGQLACFLEKRAEHYPLQYLLGETEFMSLPMKISPATLIPRNDTERIVEEAVNIMRPYSRAKVADICTGSGAIAVSLAYYLPQTEVVGIDLSAEAIKIAKENAILNRVEDRCRFLLGDLLEPLKRENIKPDMIIANPPYIPSAEIAYLSAEVQREPRMALDGGRDGLDFYRLLIDQSKNHLQNRGYLVLETGYDQKESVGTLLMEGGFMIEKTIVDFSGNHRGFVSRNIEQK